MKQSAGKPGTAGSRFTKKVNVRDFQTSNRKNNFVKNNKAASSTAVKQAAPAKAVQKGAAGRGESPSVSERAAAYK